MIDFQEEQFREVYGLIHRLRQEANALAVFLLERDGQQVTATGEIESFEPVNLASLDTGKDEHVVLSSEGGLIHAKVEPVGDGGLLAVVWDERSSLGLVRLRLARVLPRLKELWAAAGGA
ncbi:MAG TPA: hypothetical protein VG148_09405 [Pyrinomonadaceae bacterium]|nr:hypothetical protein [Pyrinomonadaceae bacterium]